MSSVETFESTLKDVVQAKRLSASKMTTLTDIALKSMQHDMQLVSILFRTHKSLSPSAKISSLYVFDALSRAARNQANKQGLKGDLNAAEGNCATFLLKVEGILDSLYQDLVSSGSAELKEKAKKILDIWIKSNTFPSAVLGRLSQILKGAVEKERDKVISAPTADPRTQTTPPSTTPPQPPPALQPDVKDVQSTLLALLSQAANAVSSTGIGQTIANTAASTTVVPALDANQLALFQQLTQTAKLGNGVPTQPIAVPVSLVPSTSSTSAVPVVPPDRGPLGTPPYHDQYGPARRDATHDRFGAPERARDRDDYYDDYRDFRGGPRGSFRGRGRGRGRWDDRERFNDRSRDREWNSLTRGRTSRSRSPPGRYNGSRDPRPYSPPRRPSFSQSIKDLTAMNIVEPPRAPDASKDEFGRDIRSGSPASAVTGAAPLNQGTSIQSLLPAATSSILPTAKQQPIPTPASDAPTRADGDPSSHSPPNVRGESSRQTQIGLDAFDPSTFDPSSAASWEALGTAWAVTHGYLPSEAELIQYTFGTGLMGAFPVPNQFMTAQMGQWAGSEEYWQQPQQSTGETWQGDREMRGRGDKEEGYHEYGNSRNAEGTRAYEVQNTGTIAHGSEDPETSPTGQPLPNADSIAVDPRRAKTGEAQAMDNGMGEGTGTGAGRMQKVGDKWVFVRTGATEVS
ncbi:uncharacterized protein LAESUDRAFT_725195 [Laetiporus sulphureus 93-53]|uniref:CID domain-containing protein n=1 Tax=Laetiporus sulphureus 93-53 TaxID=1314785 RepID=A0A165EL52_9APHY|nr:uncharacterized protein LAESUDRAFT_725195 [Laetiporus sulphureus 93-53]KZT07286.1 hypothetical protein LAESUDRAFT_725195 [Laetiporus sulphureus 93-53]